MVAQTAVLPWIAISCVFRIGGMFETMTKQFIRGFPGSLDPKDERFEQYPIPDSILILLEERRIDYISTVLELVESFKFDSTNMRCDGFCDNTFLEKYIVSKAKRACEEAVIGGLVRGAQAYKLFHPPSRPYGELSVNKVLGLARMLPNFVTTVCGLLCDAHSSRHEDDRTPIHDDLIKAVFRIGLDYLDANFKGLELKDFTKELNKPIGMAVNTSKCSTLYHKREIYMKIILAAQEERVLRQTVGVLCIIGNCEGSQLFM